MKGQGRVLTIAVLLVLLAGCVVWPQRPQYQEMSASGYLFLLEDGEGTTQFSVDDDGDVYAAGGLDFDGVLDVDGDVDLDNVSVSGTLDVTGVATLDGGADLNGTTLTVDADADTTLVASDDDVVSMTLGAGAGYFNVLTGNLKVGDGDPDGTLNGEDVYVEGFLEVDGAVDLDSTLDVASTLAVAGNISDGDSAVTFADNVLIDGATDVIQMTVQGNDTQTSATELFVVEDSTTADLFWVTATGDMELNGTTPTFTLGDADEEDFGLVFDGAAQDFYAGIYDTDDDFQIGLGSALGTTPIIVLDENQNVGLGAASAAAKLDVTGNQMIDGDTDEQQLVVQGHSTQTSATELFVVEDSTTADLFFVTATGDMELNGTTPTFTVGDSDDEDTGVVFDAGQQDFYMGVYDTADDLIIGYGTAIGTTGVVYIDENQDVGLGAASAGSKLAVTGNVLVDGDADEQQLVVQGNATQTTEELFVVEDSTEADLFWVTATGDMELNGTSPHLTLGDAGEEETGVIFDGAAQDFYAGIYDTDDDFQIGLGSALGTTAIIVLDENQNVGLGAASAAAKLDVTGNQMIDGDTDEIQLTIQGHSTQGAGLLVLEGSDETDIVVFSEPPAAAGSGDLIDVTDTFVIQDGTDHLIGMDVNLTGANHTGADNTLTGIDLSLITEDAQCTEVAIDVSDTSWDVAIEAADVPIVSTAAEWMEDFWGDTIHGELVNVEGTDPQVVALALAQEQYGVGTMVSGDDNSGGCAASCAGMSLGLHWSAAQGGLIFETRLHLDTSIADTVICAGLSDSLALVMPATIAGANYTTNAADGAFFCYDTAADTDEWHAIAVDTNVDATGIGATGEAPAFDTYQVLRIEIDAGGADAKFYIDGTLVKTLTASVVTPAVLLSPVVVIDTNADASKTVDIDYVYVTARR